MNLYIYIYIIQINLDYHLKSFKRKYRHIIYSEDIYIDIYIYILFIHKVINNLCLVY